MAGRRAERGDRGPGVYVLGREALRELDRRAIEEYGLPGVVLMENAARHGADVAIDGLEGVADPAVLVVCGPGNNGGDGLAMARHLHNAGMRVGVLLCGEPAPGTDAAINLRVTRAMKIPLRGATLAGATGELDRLLGELGRPDLVVDALFGSGLTRAIEGHLAAVVERINALGEAGSAVLSVDCPSGMDVDTGERPGACVAADVTVTFAGLKPGFLSLEAQEFLGDVVIGDIGAPGELLRELGQRLSSPDPEGEAAQEDGGTPPSRRARRRE